MIWPQRQREMNQGKGWQLSFNNLFISLQKKKKKISNLFNRGDACDYGLTLLVPLCNIEPPPIPFHLHLLLPPPLSPSRNTYENHLLFFAFTFYRFLIFFFIFLFLILYPLFYLIHMICRFWFSVLFKLIESENP